MGEPGERVSKWNLCGGGGILYTVFVPFYFDTGGAFAVEVRTRDRWIDKQIDETSSRFDRSSTIAVMFDIRLNKIISPDSELMGWLHGSWACGTCCEQRFYVWPSPP